MYGLIYKSDVKDMLYSEAESAYGDEEDLLNRLSSKVEDIQEVPAREVDTSHWITYGNLMTCEKCGNEFRINVHDNPHMSNVLRYDYCPSCGRYMKGL